MNHKKVQIFIIVFMVIGVYGCTNLDTLIKEERLEEANRYCSIELEGKEQAAGYKKLANVYYARKNYATAGKCYNFAKEYKTANECYTKAAEDAYTAKDYKKAAKYYKKAGKQIYWYKKAADELGDKQSIFLLGKAYYSGIIGEVEKDYKKAVHWYKKSADLGNEKAMFYLGNIYHKGGCGIKEDISKAIYWYKKSVDYGHKDAEKILKALYQLQDFNKLLKSEKFQQRLDKTKKIKPSPTAVWLDLPANDMLWMRIGIVVEQKQNIVVVKDVRDWTTAKRIGMRKGDYIISLAGQNIQSIEDMQAVIARLKKNEQVIIVVERKHQKKIHRFRGKMVPD